MNEQDPLELEEWKAIWQANEAWTAPLREDFERRRRKSSWEFYASIASMIVMLVFLIWRMLLMTSLPHLVFCGGACLLLCVAMAQVCWAYYSKQIATPMTPQAYVDACRQHLSVERRNVKWGQRMWPVSLVFLAIALVLIFNKAPFERFLLIVFGLAAPGYMLTWYVTFVWGPRKLQQETRRLYELERSWDDQGHPDI